MGQNRNHRQAYPKKVKKFTTKMQSTLLLLFCGILVLLLILIVVLAKINHTDGKRYSKKALSQQTYVSTSIPYKRGDITDRNGVILATSVKVYNLILDAKVLTQYQESEKETDKEYVEATLNAINQYFDIPMVELNTVMAEKSESSYVVLKKEIDSEVYEEFKTFMSDKNNKIKAVWFEEEYKRIYPKNELASQVIGFTVSGDVGTYGIEETYNDELIGTNGLSYGYFDTELNLERVNKPAINGNTIVTTIDSNVQSIVEAKIAQFVEQYPTKRVSVLVMNPNNGDIYSMATNTHYDLNNPRDLTPFYSESEIEAMSSEEKLDALYDIWRNTIISNSFEPGSTFKPFTVASALEEDVINYNDHYNCTGREHIAGNTIRCNATHNLINLTESIMYSCNSAMMQISAKEGRSLLYKYQKAFLFGERTNIDLPGEDIGIIKKEEDINPIDLAPISFGQTDQYTMIQIASAFCSLVNGGYYYEPHVMKQIETDSGSVVKRNDGIVVNQTISKETSKFLQQALYKTVEEGTATGAKVEGYAIGGKTGTAEKYPRGDNRFVLSFIGAVPIDDPEVLIYVTLDEVDDPINYKNSKLATTMGGEILKEILPFLGVYPSGDIDYSIWGIDVEHKDETDIMDPGEDGILGTEDDVPAQSDFVYDENAAYDPDVLDDGIGIAGGTDQPADTKTDEEKDIDLNEW